MDQQEKIKLALALRNKKKKKENVIEVVDRQLNKFSLSSYQEHMWMHEHLNEELGGYQSIWRYRIKGNLNIPILEDSFNKVIKRHEVLRTQIIEIEGVPYQKISSLQKYNIDILDVSNKSKIDQDLEIKNILNERIELISSNSSMVSMNVIQISNIEYILLLIVHHIVADGWSATIFMDELSQYYNNSFISNDIDLPNLPVQYIDYSMWQRKALQSGYYNKQLQFWSEKLSGTLPILEFPKVTLSGDSHIGASRIKFTIRKELVSTLKTIAQKEGTTLYTVLLAAFKSILFRYTRESDLIVATPISTRNRIELEKLIGLFVNTICLRSSVNVEQSFSTYIKELKQIVIESLANPDLPFGELVRSLKIERNYQNPLNQIMFVYQGDSDGVTQQLKLNDVEVEVDSIDSGQAKFDVMLSLVDTPQCLYGELEYNPEKIDFEIANQMTQEYHAFLENVIDHLHTPIYAIPSMSDIELTSLLNTYNREINNSLELNVVQLFEKQSNLTPNSVAVIYENQAYSYKDINQESQKLACFLSDSEIGPGKLVGVYLERSVDVLVTLLAIFKTGAAYVPMDMNYPIERIEYIAIDAKVSLIVAKQSLPSQLNGIKAIILDHLSEKNESDFILPSIESNRSLDNLAYVIYTSGSTGTPKGVQVSHRSVINILSFVSRKFEISEKDVFLAISSFSFDISVIDLFLPLINGANVVIASQEAVYDSRQLKELIDLYNVSFMQGTPSAWRMLINENWDVLKPFKVVSTGEALPPDLANSLWNKGNGNFRIWNMYGPTETTIWSAIFEMKSILKGNVPIGRPVANTQLYVLDEYMQPVPAGVTGELYIGGAGLSVGYLNRSELTIEKFVPNPFEINEDSRLYRTGDLARFLSDGNVEYLGRIDYQVKIRGFRIELGEVEAALLEHKGVREAVATARENIPGEKQLVAYVSGKQEDLPVRNLREHLKNTLPEYMIPSAFVVLEKLPLNANGKVDRQALPKPDISELEEHYMAPQSTTEQILAGIWSDVLGLKQVGRNDNFFERGGHSLLAMQLLSRVRQVFGVNVQLRSFFERPSVAELANEVEKSEGLHECPEISIRRYSREDNIALSYAQQRLWFLDQLEPGSAAYNMPIAVRLTGPLNVKALEDSFTMITVRHEALRTTFHQVDGEPVQRIQSVRKLELPSIHVAGENEIDREAKARTLAEQEAQQPFDLTHGPLIRGQLLQLGNEDHVLLVTMHHIVSDGWSMGILTRELITLYEAKNQGKEANLPELPIQYADYATWQREWLQAEVLEQQVDYWKKQLKGPLPILNLPLDKERPSTRTTSGGVKNFSVGANMKNKIDELIKNQNTTLYIVLHAVFHTLLSKFSGQSEIIIGTPISGRNYKTFENVVGMFVNTLPIRAELTPNVTFLDAIEEIKRIFLASYNNQDIPFDTIVEQTNTERFLNRHPVFDVAISVQHDWLQKAEKFRDLRMSIQDFATHTSKFDLMLFVTEVTSRIDIALEYNTDLFEEETIELMGQYLIKILEQLTTEPRTMLKDIELVNENDLIRIVNGLNATTTPYPKESTIAELFEEQVSLSPNAIAVVSNSQEVSYYELNNKANHLARNLRSLGVMPDEIVGIYLGNCFELMVGIFGVLKSGGAYLLIDPELPDERIQYMLKDSGARIIVGLEEKVPFLFHNYSWLNIQTSVKENMTFDNVPNISNASNLAYLIYTSGSTGNPKGVLIEQRNVVRLVRNTNFITVEPSDIFLQTGAVGFDAITFEIFGALLNGSSIHMVDKSTILDQNSLHSYLDTHKITIMWLTSPLFSQVSEGKETMFNRLKYLIIGGDVLSTHHVQAVRSVCPNLRVINGYGPTENTTFSTYMLIDKEYKKDIPIGYPIANSTCYIVSSENKLQPIGIPGELLVGGDGVARGYANLNELTESKFVTILSIEEGRLYRTGDLARWLPNGEIEFLGRIDNQVKVRGYRIELDEIQEVIQHIPGVRTAVVMAQDTEKGSQRLVAYVIGDKVNLEIQRIHEYIKTRLPSYMVPSHYAILDTLPLNNNGKIDKSVLLQKRLSHGVESYTAPKTDIELQLAQIWCDILDEKRVGIHDNFFVLGGHSLLATQLMSRIRTTFSVDVALKSLFDSPTIAELAVVIEKKGVESNKGIAINQTSRDHNIQLSYAQHRLWFLDRMDPGSASYNIPAAIKLSGKLDQKALEKSIGAVIERHESLRTIFVTDTDGNPFQIIQPYDAYCLPIIELEAQTEHERKFLIRQLVNEEAMCSFDLEIGPLFRCKLVKVNKEEHVLIMNMHHIISDGWSVAVFIREITVQYEGFVQGREARLKKLHIQYADFAQWQRDWLDGEVLMDQIEYWKRQLEGLTVLKIPTGYLRSENQTHHGAMYTWEFDEETVKQLRLISQREGVTMFMLLLAAFKTLLARYSGQTDVAVGTDIANRNREEIEGIIGFFVNQVVIRSNLSGDLTFTSLLARIKEVTLGAYANQDVPFDKVVQAVNPNRNDHTHPLFEVKFVLQENHWSGIKIHGLEVELMDVGTYSPKFDLLFNLTQVGGKIVGNVEYRSDLFKAQTIEQIIFQYGLVIQRIIKQPSVRIYDLIKDIPKIGKSKSRILSKYLK